MDDGECIEGALKEMGYPYEKHRTSQSLYGYQGDMRQQKAHIIVRRQHVGAAANDVGFLKKSNGRYEMIISEFDRRQQKQGGDFMKKLKMLYTKQKFVKQAKRLGFRLTSQSKQKDGSLKIKVSQVY